MAQKRKRVRLPNKVQVGHLTGSAQKTRLFAFYMRASFDKLDPQMVNVALSQLPAILDQFLGEKSKTKKKAAPSE